MAELDLPLHVQVAEALGWTELREQAGKWRGKEPAAGLVMEVPRYDISWCSVGPVLERFKVSLGWDWISGNWSAFSRCWDAPDPKTFTVEARTPMMAVCALIVGLHKARETAA